MDIENPQVFKSKKLNSGWFAPRNPPCPSGTPPKGGENQ